MPSPFDTFNPGFSGLLGTGAGMKSASSREVINFQTINNLENAMMQLWSLFNSAGYYGLWIFETLETGYTTETFDGDGTTTDFNISKSVAREMISGWDINLENPYASGILPAGYGGELTNFDSNTNLTSGVSFTTAPPVGTGNVIIRYKYPQSWGSSLAGSAYFSDYEFTG